MTNAFNNDYYISANIDALKRIFEENYIIRYRIEDVSNKNDGRASIHVSQGVSSFIVFLPNALMTDRDKEEYSFYSVILDDEYATDKTIEANFDNIRDVSEFLFDKMYQYAINLINKLL
jgi:hypothetical protein